MVDVRSPKWETASPYGYRILVPVSSEAEAVIVFPLVEALARVRQGQILLMQVVEVPPGKSLSEAAGEAIQARERLETFIRKRYPQGEDLEQGRGRPPIRVLVKVARNIWEGIWEAAVQERVDLLVLHWGSPLLTGTMTDRLQDPRLMEPPCDLILVRTAPTWKDESAWRQVKHILLPVRESPHSIMALRVADALAEVLGAQITVLFVIPPNGAETGQTEAAFRAAFGPVLRELRSVTRTIVVEGEVAETILAETAPYQILVMGSSESSRDWLGMDLRHVAEGTQMTLVITRKMQPRPQARAAELLRPRQHPIAVLVDKWFAENTFHSREFEDLEQLVRLKEKQGVTISLGLPALNEEETIGAVIDTVKTALMDEVPLLDEIVLIDSGSVDYTREIAMDKGIPVYIHQEILPQYGAYHGKGEALWKSLYVLSGDIIVWIDTDIRNIHPRFVYGVVGPLLKYPHIQYVKGFYRRPLKQGERMIAGGGGRVTELTARPLFNLFFPELSGLIQPLSGEYAGRREALERLPFFTGYGVETGLLIDILELYGLHAIAQVDLLERVHRNQPLSALSKMSFAIIQVVIKRLEERHKIHLLEDINKTMNLIRYEPGRYFLEPVEIREYERPPMLTIPEYRAKRGLPPLQPEEREALMARAQVTW